MVSHYQLQRNQLSHTVDQTFSPKASSSPPNLPPLRTLQTRLSSTHCPPFPLHQLHTLSGSSDSSNMIKFNAPAVGYLLQLCIRFYFY
ncbi:hypothetical protein Hanom_Chr10g00919431 [Helianthus anomalus]